MFTMTLDEALAIYAQPKARGRRPRPRRRCASWARTRRSGKPVVVKDGRFGPYVTDGETNATLRKGDDVDTMTVQRAAELLADRRASAPARPAARTTRRAPARSATKTAAKSGTKPAAEKSRPPPGPLPRSRSEDLPSADTLTP